MIDNNIDIEEELEIFEDSIKMINPFQIKQYFALKENKKYYLPVFKSIVKKWEGEQKPGDEPKPKKKKLKQVNLNIEEDETPPPPSPVVVPVQQKKITSPNGLASFEVYLDLRLQPDKDAIAKDLIKKLEQDFIDRGFNAMTAKDIKKKINLVRYQNLVISPAIQRRIDNPVAPVAPVAPSSVVPQPKKRGRPPKKKIPEGSNKLVLIDNIIKQSNMTTKLLKEYYDYEFENQESR